MFYNVDPSSYYYRYIIQYNYWNEIRCVLRRLSKHVLRHLFGGVRESKRQRWGMATAFCHHLCFHAIKPPPSSDAAETGYVSSPPPSLLLGRFSSSRWIHSKNKIFPLDFTEKCGIGLKHLVSGVSYFKNVQFGIGSQPLDCGDIVVWTWIQGGEGGGNQYNVF